jgi:predicted N-acetyltransferase YhbS
MVTARLLQRDEIEDVWSIDRREVIEGIYYHQDGRLVLKREHYDVKGWPPGEAKKYTPLLLECYNRGGWFYGLFDGDRLIGIAVLESKPQGKNKDQLQLKFMQVGNGYRGRGLGRQLFEASQAKAGEMGARRLYISATPSENTVRFYLSMGCRLASELDPELFALEPEDIHLECDL